MRKTLRIFAFSDIHSPDDFEIGEIDPNQFDLVVTLGDISEATLDYILYQAKNVPCFGVPGNHDKADPAGLTNIHGKVIDFHGIRIGGIGGSRKYKDEPNHYSSRQMNWIVNRLSPADLILSHSPPLATSLNEDRLHQGFACFDRYIKLHKPQAWLHGHTGKTFTGGYEGTAVYGINVRRPLTLELKVGMKRKPKRAAMLASMLLAKLNG